MNLRFYAHYVRHLIMLLGGFMLFPFIYSLIVRENEASFGFLITILFCGVSFLILSIAKHDGKASSARESFVAVGICWIVLSFIGGLPFFVSREIPSLLDSFFEAVSGFTTTGFSMALDVEAMSKSLLLWRAFTHWIGGMGVLVFLLAIVNSAAKDRTLNLLKAESPGPTPGKLVPKLRQSSKILYIIYLLLTIVQILFLLAGKMPFFDSLCTAMSTAGTGGFAVRNASIAAYNSVYLEVVCTVFMALFGVNFNVYFLVVMKNFSGAFKNEELRAYFGIIAVAIAAITLDLTFNTYHNIAQSLRFASFQVSSVITTTGFSNSSMDSWPTFSKTILFILTFIGASAGSTGGGIKVSRIVILVREARRSMFRIGNPRVVEHIKIEGKMVDRATAHAVSNFFFAIITVTFVSVLFVSLDKLDFGSAMALVATCINNIGSNIGIVDSSLVFPNLNPLTKLVLCFDMLIGRLEVYPILLIFSPRTFRRI